MLNVKIVAPKVLVDLRYATPHNFVGEVIRGYENDFQPLLEEKTAFGLQKASELADQMGYTLVLYEAYRPRAALEHFLEWAQNSSIVNKELFYPKLAKEDLFAFGYIAKESVHSKGQAVDVSLLPKGQDLKIGIQDGTIDMGCHFDLFDEIAHTETELISPAQRANRFLLRELMKEAGFSGIPHEWWHFNFNPL